MRRKIRCEVKSEIFYKIFWELNKALVYVWFAAKRLGVLWGCAICISSESVRPRVDWMSSFVCIYYYS